jgi:hypothetical protein
MVKGNWRLRRRSKEGEALMAESRGCRPKGHAGLEVQLDRGPSRKAVGYVNGTKARRR